jgi:hypothetical protein
MRQRELLRSKADGNIAIAIAITIATSLRSPILREINVVAGN